MESITKFFKEENDAFYQRGEAVGEARGEAIGEARGELNKAIAIAIEMKNEGITVEQIARFTKLSIEEIEKL